MISTLRGIPHISLDRKSVVIETSGGVGYVVFVTPACAASLVEGREATLFTYLRVAEGVMDLYGFESLEAKSLFERLISVSGVGPKTALGVLATGSASALEDAISRGDVSYLTSVQGIGKKTAERLVVELKGKMANTSVSYSSVGLQEAAEALLSMGYDATEVRQTLQTLDQQASVTTLIKQALALLQR